MLSDVLKSATLLALFTLTGASSLVWVHASTKDRIAENERELLLTRLNEIVPAGTYNNDLATDTYAVNAPEFLGSDETLQIYRARQQNQPVAAILTAIAPDGYNGAIRLLIGITTNGDIAGVRVVSHRETPGLGDKIDASRSAWILGFNGKSIDNTKAADWAVKQDGGKFDSLTGATITPRAVVKAVHKSLVYFKANREKLFSTAQKDG